MGDAPNKEEVIDTDMVNELVIESAMRNVSYQISIKNHKDEKSWNRLGLFVSWYSHKYIRVLFCDALMRLSIR